jgi:hypothetical protein
MQKYFPKSQGIDKFIRLSTLFTTIVTLSYSNTAQADVNGIPSNPDFPNAQYPYAQAPDGCSSWDSDHPEYMRDTWGPVDFSGGCNTHDKCYYTLGSNWQSCNERFNSDLRAACERDLRTSIQVPAPTLTDPFRTRRVDGPPDPVRLPVCYGIASTYYTGVQVGVVKIKWADTFNKAQDKQRRYEEWVSSIRNASASNQPNKTTVMNRPFGSNVSFRTAAKGLYIVAENGGSGIIGANRSAVGPWETFRLIDLNGGSLTSGDVVNLASDQGTYVTAEDGGGGTLNVNRPNAGPWEEITILKANGSGEIHSGDIVVLRTKNGQFIVAEDGGGGRVNANRTAIGPWEQFIIELR